MGVPVYRTHEDPAAKEKPVSILHPEEAELGAVCHRIGADPGGHLPFWTRDQISMNDKNDRLDIKNDRLHKISSRVISRFV